MKLLLPVPKAQQGLTHAKPWHSQTMTGSQQLTGPDLLCHGAQGILAMLSPAMVRYNCTHLCCPGG